MTVHRLFRLQCKPASGALFERVAAVSVASGMLELHGDGVPELTVTPEMLPHERFRPGLFDAPQLIRGRLTWELKFRTPVTSTGQVGDATTLVTPTPFGELMRVAFGGSHRHTDGGEGAGSAVASGATTTGWTVTSGHGERFPAGSAVALDPNALGRYEVREILEQATNDLDLKIALSQAPSGTNALYGGITYYPVEVLTERMHFLALAHDGIHQWKLTNGQCMAFEWELSSAGVWMSTQTWRGYGWAYESGHPLAGAAYNEIPIVARDSETLVTPTAGTTRTLPYPSRLTFSVGRQVVPHESPTGEHGCVAWIQTGPSPAMTGSFSVRTDSVGGAPLDETYRDAMHAGTLFQIAQQVGAVEPGELLLLSVPTVEIHRVDQFEDVGGGVEGEVVHWRALKDALAVGSGELAKAPWRLHCR